MTDFAAPDLIFRLSRSNIKTYISIWFEQFLNSITFCPDEYDAIKGCDAVVLMTEWNQFRSLDMNRVLDSLKGRYFFDFRNIYNRNEMESLGFDYYAVGM